MQAPDVILAQQLSRELEIGEPQSRFTVEDKLAATPV